MATPLVDALTTRECSAWSGDADHLIALDAFARRLEESHARLLAVLIDALNDSGQWHDDARAAIEAALEIK